MKQEKKYTFTMEVSVEDLIHLEDDDYHVTDQVFLKTKSDILSSLRADIKVVDKSIEQLKLNNDNVRVGVFTTLKEMLSKIYTYTKDDPILPMPINSGWSYYVRTTSDGVTLELWHEDNRETMIDEDGEEYSAYTSIDQRMIVYDIKPKYLTINDFAEKYGVEPVTIRQWIRRGKIRNAKKEGSEWRISELAIPLTSRGYKRGFYSWDYTLSNIPEEYSFINDYSSACFYQDETDKKVYHVSLQGGRKAVQGLLLDLTIAEREKLEYVLIGNPNVKPNEMYIDLYAKDQF